MVLGDLAKLIDTGAIADSLPIGLPSGRLFPDDNQLHDLDVWQNLKRKGPDLTQGRERLAACVEATLERRQAEALAEQQDQEEVGDPLQGARPDSAKAVVQAKLSRQAAFKRDKRRQRDERGRFKKERDFGGGNVKDKRKESER